jgi:hypothetical protein
MGKHAGLTLFLACVLVSAGTVFSQRQAQERSSDRLQQRVVALELEGEPIFAGLAKLSAEFGIPISVEFILRGDLASPAVANPRFSAKVENKNVREVLDWLCALDSRYLWARDQEMVNVFPRMTHSAPSAYLLTRRFTSIEFQNAMDPSTAVFYAVSQLPGPLEQVAFQQSGGAPGFSRPFSGRYSNLTVRQVFNRIAQQLGAELRLDVLWSKEFPHSQVPRYACAAGCGGTA